MKLFRRLITHVRKRDSGENLKVNVVEETGAAPMPENGRIGGSVKMTFRSQGFMWLAGDDGVDYFGHQVHIQGGTPIGSLWIGQRCKFRPNEGDRGPYATMIVMSKE